MNSVFLHNSPQQSQYIVGKWYCYKHQQAHEGTPDNDTPTKKTLTDWKIRDDHQFIYGPKGVTERCQITSIEPEMWCKRVSFKLKCSNPKCMEIEKKVKTNWGRTTTTSFGLWLCIQHQRIHWNQELKLKEASSSTAATNHNDDKEIINLLSDDKDNNIAATKKSTLKSPPAIASFTRTVLPNDVLLGRGVGHYDHIRNIKFRDLVATRKQEYL